MAYYILFDNFDDNSIDTDKWDETDPNSRVAETSSQLQISNPHSAVRVQFADKLQSDLSVSSGVVSVQCDLTWSDDGNEAYGGIFLYVDDNNWAGITSRALGGTLRFWIYDGGSQVYSSESAITKNKTVKIEYDISAGEIKFFYWDGSWTQAGATQEYDIGSTC